MPHDPAPSSGRTRLTIGCYPDPSGDNGGVWRAWLDDRTGGLSDLELLVRLPSASWLEPLPPHAHVAGMPGILGTDNTVGDGARSCFAVTIEENGGQVAIVEVWDGGGRELVRLDSGGSFPCHVRWIEGRGLYVANYGDGVLAEFPAGGIGRVPIRYEGHGGGPNGERQEGPHAHVVAEVFPGVLAVCDLGADQIRLYAGASGALEELPPVALPAGCGPRHLALGPAGPLLIEPALTEPALAGPEATEPALAGPEATEPALAGPEAAEPALAGPEAAGLAPAEPASTIRANAKRLVYLACELSGDLITLRADPDARTLTPVAVTPASGRLGELPTGRTAISQPSGIAVLPDGATLVIANRGPGTLASFAIGPHGQPDYRDDGAADFGSTPASLPTPALGPTPIAEPTPVAERDAGCAWPRSFTPCPRAGGGHWLVVAGQDTSELSVVPCEPDGTLGDVAARLSLPGVPAHVVVG